MPGTRLVFHARDEEAPGTSPILLKRWDDEHIATYGPHYAWLNPWVGLWARAPLLVPIWTESTLPSSSFVNSEFYNDWLRKVGEAACATGIKLIQEKGRNASFDIDYGSGRMEQNHKFASRVRRRSRL